MIKIYIDKLPENYNKENIIKQNITNPNNFKIGFVYKSDFKNTKTLRDFADIVGKILGFSKKQRSRIILITDELNNNAIEYGSSKNSENELRIIVEKKSEGLELCIEVEDNGKGKAPKTSLDMEVMRAHKLKRGYFNHNSIRGRGLFLITVNIVDRLYFKNSENGGLIVGIRILKEKDLIN